MNDREIAEFHARQAEVGKWDASEVLAYIGMALCALFTAWMFSRFGIAQPGQSL